MNKLFRWVRFCIQKLGVFLSRPRVIALNDLQVSLIGDSNIAGIVKNKIEYPEADISDGAIKRKFITYIGRGDPEKGVDVFSHPDFNCPFPLMLIGPDQHSVKTNNMEVVDLGWQENNEIKQLLRESVVGIFPSCWYEVDPLVPWSFIARGVPVISNIDNLFGLYLKKRIPELVYADVYELNEILKRMSDKAFYKEFRDRSIELYRKEKESRTANWERVWRENII